MMLGRKYISAVILFCLIALHRPVSGAVKFGVIFDINGDAIIMGEEGNITELKRDRHVLRTVFVGDTIEVIGPGKVLVVSARDKKGYELLSDSKAEVKYGGVVGTRGKVNIKEGYNVPSYGVVGDIGGVVSMNAKRQRCIWSLIPLNTSVLTLTPALRWKNSCAGTRMVTVMVLNDRNIIFEEITDKSTITIPPGILREDRTYMWLIDGGPASAITGGTLHTLDREFADIIRQKSESSAQKSAELPERLSFLFLLIDRNLVELADAEIERLKMDFPDNPFIRKLNLE